MYRTARSIVTFLLLLGAPVVADACSVPVFRYALDHWTPDGYTFQVLHRSSLTGEQSALVQRLQEQIGARFSNATVEVIDLNQTDDPALAVRFDESAAEGQPLCVVRGPTGTPDVHRDVWSGALTESIVDAWLGSPLRDQLARQLLGGTSVVWVYLESGVAAVDDVNFRRLQTALARLEGELELPEIDPSDLKELSTSPEDVKLKLSAVRLSRDDPAEAPLVEMLLASEPDLRDAAFISEPMAFPVFGRGRVLYALVGQGITDELIEEACRFLIGACQCTVKAQNPGVDLLLSVDWDGLIAPSAPAAIDVTLTGLAGFQSDAAAGAAAAPGPVTESAAGSASETPEPGVAVAGAEQPIAPEAEDSQLPIVVPRVRTAPGPFMRPGVVIAILAVLVIVGSFFLIPRK